VSYGSWQHWRIYVLIHVTIIPLFYVQMERFPFYI